MMRTLFAMLVLLWAAPATADELRPGYLEFSQQSETTWRLVWKVPRRGGITPLAQPLLPKGCNVTRLIERTQSAMAIKTVSAVTCPTGVSSGRIGVSGMAAAQTDILARVAPLGRPVQAMRLTAAVPEAEIRPLPDRWNVARTYFATGVAHILTGYDHLLFVVALVLLLGRLRTIAWAVTAFTLAHSITLIGTTLGLIGLPQRPVECVIALSILFLAVEIVKADPAAPRLSERVPWLIAFLFGLLHGFGFAGALKEIGLPESDVPTALLTFNLGVEAGQLLIVATSLTALALIRRFAEGALRPAVVGASYAIGIIASVWFFERSFA
jgi:hydrogenase/urease accessory protein HupE